MQHPEWKTEFADVCQPVSEGRGMMQQCQDTFVLSNLTQPSSDVVYQDVCQCKAVETLSVGREYPGK